MLAHNISLHLGNYRSLYPYSISPDCFWLDAGAGYTQVPATVTAAITAWSSFYATASTTTDTLDPIGGLNAVKITESGASQTQFLYRYASNLDGFIQGPVRVQVWVKAGTQGYAWIGTYSGLTAGVIINLATGAPTHTGSDVYGLTITNAGNGWWKVDFSTYVAYAAVYIEVGASDGSTFNYAGTGKTIYAWHNGVAAWQDRSSKQVDQNPLHTSPAEWTQATPASQLFWQNPDPALCVGTQLWPGKAALWDPTSASHSLATANAGVLSLVNSGKFELLMLLSRIETTLSYMLYAASVGGSLRAACTNQVYVYESISGNKASQAVGAGASVVGYLFDGTNCATYVDGNTVTGTITDTFNAASLLMPQYMPGKGVREMVLTPLLNDGQRALMRAGFLARAA